MPWMIVPINKMRVKVININTRRVVAKNTTPTKARKQLKAIGMNAHKRGK